MIAPQDHDIRQSRRVLELQNRDIWIRPTDLFWHFPILVTIREMPFRNYLGSSFEKLKVRENKIEAAIRQKTEKRETRIGTQLDGSGHPGLGLLHRHRLPGENGVKTRHTSVLIGSQLIGTAPLTFRNLKLKLFVHALCGNMIAFCRILCSWVAGLAGAGLTWLRGTVDSTENPTSADSGSESRVPTCACQCACLCLSIGLSLGLFLPFT